MSFRNVYLILKDLEEYSYTHYFHCLSESLTITRRGHLIEIKIKDKNNQWQFLLDCCLQLQGSNVSDHLIPPVHAFYIQHYRLQGYSPYSTGKSFDLDSFIGKPLSVSGKGLSFEVQIKGILPNHQYHLFSGRLTLKPLLLHFIFMFEIILVQFLDINRKYNFIEVIPYILEI